MKSYKKLSVSVVAVVLSKQALACSSCGCTLNSDWSSQGYVAGKGVSIDVRYDYFNQSDLRSGTQSLDRSDIEIPNEQEIQQQTENNNVMVSLDYGFSRNWGVAIQMPYFDRYHATIAEGDTEASESHTRSIGDIRLLGRYQGFTEDLSYGVQFGIKLPTGRIDAPFISGPQAGELLDRGLQPGTGTTDLLLGAFKIGELAPALTYFTQFLYQQPLNSRDEFKPGAGVNLNLGMRYTAKHWLAPQLQFNARIEDRESGANADVENSGATLIFVSPGVAFKFASRADAFVFVQLPIYQHVNGLQLEPEYFVSVGFHYRY